MSSTSTSSSTVAVGVARTERVKVFCRLRPLLPREKAGISFEDCTETEHEALEPQEPERPPSGQSRHSTTFVTGTDTDFSNGIVSVKPDRKTIVLNNSQEFTFDASMDQFVDQAEMYTTVGYEIVQDVLQGYNGTILAYGQTSTGKTHTMVGKDDLINGDNRGIIPRALEEIFNNVEMTRQKVKTTILMSYVQIYCERIFDLLDPEVNSSNLLIREDPERGVFIEGAACFPVTNVQECLKALEHGNTNRAVASTTMNAHSSRSHAVIILRIERKHYPTAADETMNNINKAEAMEAPQLLKISHLYLVDLAGSERVKKTNVYGRHVEELKAINLSLSALGNCISALSKQQKHIPYRDSKLTRLLQSSLGGNVKTSLIVTITPAETEQTETISTLKFGQRAMKVQVKAHMNMIADYKALYESMQAKLDMREDRIQELEMNLQKQKQAEQLALEQVTKCELRIQHLEFQYEALKIQTTTTEEATTSQHSTTGTSNHLILVLKHQQDLEETKKKYEEQVVSFKKVANQASQEWNNLQHELTHEKENILCVLQELKEMKLKYFTLEKENAIRIEELLQEKKEKKKKIQQKKIFYQQEILNHTKNIKELEQKIQVLETKNQELEEKIVADYVPRETLNQMENLYESAIVKLQSRVSSLETRSQTKTPPSNNQQHGGGHGSTNQQIKSTPIETNAQNSHEIAYTTRNGSFVGSTRGVPQVGRVIPPSKQNLFSMNR